MNVGKYVLTVALLGSCGIALAAKPIVDQIDIPVPVNFDGSRPGIEDVKSAIRSGCKEKRWIPVLVDNNNITCSILVRTRHFAEVEIPFTADNYSIIYKDSRGLDYYEKKQRIHRNYNKWVTSLSASIQRQFAISD